MRAALFASPEVEALFAPEAFVQRMLDFEAALARAEARAGVIPAAAAEAIAAACRVERIDVAALLRDAVPAGTPAIPLVRQLTRQVEGDGAGYVHWGATSQDAIDTALVLQIREALRLLEAGLLAVGSASAALAERHRATPMAGRTLLQQALPITFGLKAARWLALATRQVEALRALRPRVLVVQLGGAAGTVGSLGGRGIAVVERLGEELGLGVPALPWHAERDRVAELASALGVVAGAMAKIATDLILLAQSEVGEVAEGSAPGKGGSSTLPQKRNPVDAVEAIAAARLAIGLVPVVLNGLVQEHERAAGGWQVEWAAIPELFGCAAGAVEHVRAALAGLEVDGARMRANLEASGGLIVAESLSFALAARLGRDAAHAIVAELSRQAAASTLRQVALADRRVTAVLSEADVDAALDPARYLGSADAFVERALKDFARLPPMSS
ncbi:MAG TPA: 3-carboxy-cis,cis-muconate cycloisomerase [Chloroflexota bacterium]